MEEKKPKIEEGQPVATKKPFQAQEPGPSKGRFLPILIILAVAVLVIGTVFYLERSFPEFLPLTIPYVSIEPGPGESPEPTPGVQTPAAVLAQIKTFASEEEFKEYLQESEELGLMGFLGVEAFALRESAVSPDLDMPMAAEGGIGGAVPKVAERISETNVQVLGIDEPDIVKTNGSEIFYSERNYWLYRSAPVPMMERDMYWPEQKQETKIITAFPIEDLALTETIDKQGDLLLSDDMLVIFEGRNIYGFDVSDPKNPKEDWEMELGEKDYLVSSRLYNNSIYIVVGETINQARPCPIYPVTIGGAQREIACSSIYHPVSPVAVDTTYTVFKVDPESGDIKKTVSFVGYSGNSLLYMSAQNLFVTFSYYPDVFSIFSRFFSEEMADLLPNELVSKLKKLESYDLSFNTKMTELMTLLEKYSQGLTKDEELQLENEMENRAETYFAKHIREMELTGITRISLDDLSVASVGSVPGHPLNQFSLDEYNGYLRVAVTVGERSRFWGFGGTMESANDVYVLDSNLRTVGEVKDLGLTERIYSARFLGERGYLVTFRQIDPFYVLDMSDPKNPEMKGELKIPGFSSYLHPIEGDKILGVGKEGSKVKISLFDATDAQNPKEVSKYMLNEYWTEVSNNHHAFLMDKKHGVFFLPGSKGGYIFSYENDDLKLKKAVSGINAKRAIYLDDYMYILSATEVIVLDENTWERVKEMDL